MSMTLAEFKAKLGVSTLPMYKSTTGSGRHVGSVGDVTYLTKPGIDTKKPLHVYNSIDADTGEELQKVFIISDKAPREADLTL